MTYAYVNCNLLDVLEMVSYMVRKTSYLYLQYAADRMK